MKYYLLCILLVPLAALADTSTYICDYPIWSDETGKHKTNDKFTLTFIVDHESKKSYMLGNLGSVEVKLVDFSDQLVFIQLTDTGNVMSTTITGKLKSVHSRNSVMMGELIPSQYYGNCVKK